MAEYNISKENEFDFFKSMEYREFSIIEKIVNSILKSIERKKKRVDALEVFFQDGSSLILTIEKENYKECLENCIDDFAKQDKFEECIQIKEVIESL
jgi:hypothetical protein